MQFEYRAKPTSGANWFEYRWNITENDVAKLRKKYEIIMSNDVYLHTLLGQKLRLCVLLYSGQIPRSHSRKRSHSGQSQFTSFLCVLICNQWPYNNPLRSGPTKNSYKTGDRPPILSILYRLFSMRLVKCKLHPYI